MDKEEKEITFYLEGWQKRFLRDCGIKLKIPRKFIKMKVVIKNPKEWVMYRQPIWEEIREGGFQFYLTDSQIEMVVEAMGVDAGISALNVSPKMIEAGQVVIR